MRMAQKTMFVLLALTLLLAGIALPATATSHTFHDVRDGAWCSDAIQFVYENDIMGGVGGGRFNPQGSLTRAAAATLLFRMHHSRPANAEDSRDNPFADVGNTWYAPYITWAHHAGIVQGAGGRFAPHDTVTREQFAVMCQRYLRYEELAGALTWQLYDFPDYAAVSGWARDGMNEMAVWGVIRGTDGGRLNPRGNIRRAEAAVMMQRFMELSIAPLVCPGCGDERMYFLPDDIYTFEYDAVIVVLTRCATRIDNREWTAEDFSDIEGVLYVSNRLRLSDREYRYVRRAWDAERDAHILNTPEAWQALGEADRAVRENTLVNWRTFTRSMLIRLDRECEENVSRIICQLHRQHEFVTTAQPNFISRPAMS